MDVDGRVHRLTYAKPLTVGPFAILPAFGTGHPLAAKVFITGRRDANTVFMADNVQIGRRLDIDFQGKGNVVFISKGVSFFATKLMLRHDDNLILIGPDCRLKTPTLFADGSRASIILGTGVTFESGVMIAQEPDMHISIGDDGMLSHDVALRTSDSHGIQDLATGQRINPPGPIELAAHVWLGNSARIGKGVVVGTNTVIAQRALLVADAEANSIYGGVPARKIKSGVTWTRAMDTPL